MHRISRITDDSYIPDDEDKVTAMVDYFGYSHAEAVAFLIDAGELADPEEFIADEAYEPDMSALALEHGAGGGDPDEGYEDAFDWADRTVTGENARAGE